MADQEGESVRALREHLILGEKLDEWLRSEHRGFREHTSQMTVIRLQGRARFMLLAAGIVGVVAPLLRTQAAVAVDVARLGQVSAVMVAALVWAAVAYFFDHVLYRKLAYKFTDHIEALRLLREALAVPVSRGHMPRDEDVLSAKGRSDEAMRAFQKFAEFKEQLRTLDELVFQGLIVIGLLLLAIAFV